MVDRGYATKLENWLKANCPHCSANNWINIDGGDDSTIDVQVILCHGCKSEFWISDETEEVFMACNDEEDANVENGRPLPE